MKLSTKGKYALEIAVDLAVHSAGEYPESLRSISERRGLSEKYLERIIKMLRSAGVVTSARGARGGYCLAVPAEELTVKDVLCAAEGELAPVDCLIQEKDCGIRCGACPTKDVWARMWSIITETAEGITIAQLAETAETEYNRNRMQK